MTESTSLVRVTDLVAPIVADLKLDLYDLEFRGGTLRITIDTPPGSPGGVSLDIIALATRLISRDLDYHDPVPGHYVLEVSSPGLERALRTPIHFQREIGKDVALRLRDIGEGGERRVKGRLVAADDAAITVLGDDGVERSIGYDHIDRAKTVFEWGPGPKPGAPKSGTAKPGSLKQGRSNGAPNSRNNQKSTARRSRESAADEPHQGTDDASADPSHPLPTHRSHKGAEA